MTAHPYESAAEHLRDHIELIKLVIEIVARRRRLGQADQSEAVEALIADARAKEQIILARERLSPLELRPIERLRASFGLSSTEVRVLLALTAFELDTSLRAAVRTLMNDPTRVHPDVGLLATLIYDDGRSGRLTEELGSDGKLVRFALIRIDSMRETAFSLRRARVSERVLDLLHGRDVLDRDLARYADLRPPVDAATLVIDRSRLDEIHGLVVASIEATKAARPHPIVIVTGPEGVGRKTLLAAAATSLGLGVIRVRCSSFPKDETAIRSIGQALLREAVLWHALVVLDDIDKLTVEDPAFRVDAALFGEYLGPVAAVGERVTSRPPQLARGTVIVELEPPAESQRDELWQRSLRNEAGPEISRWAAERYVVTPGVLIKAAESARAIARTRPSDELTITHEDIHAGLRSVLDAKLGTLGTRVTWRQTWADLVLSDEGIQEIRDFIGRVKHRRQVYEDWGFGKKVAKGLGLSALFSGPPGTGKTMVAGIIADELKLDLYQIDLSKIVSKWVGETEKNLAALFDAAETGHAVLLFDEADSLFSKRTEVKSSVDRYANLEVNYLLQRMEEHRGITILTTNHATSIDDAFKRRLSTKIDFLEPDVDERERLWKTMLPAKAATSSDINFEALASKFVMTGGYIKNAVLRAAFLAADEGVPIAMRHLLRGAQTEYQSMGKIG